MSGGGSLPGSAGRQVAALTWGLKESFRNYVAATGGAIEPGGGAERTEDGTFTFALAPDSSLSLDADGKLEGQGRFVGDVQFTGHGGMLSVCIASPILEVSPSGATLSVDDSRDRPRRLVVAHLDMAAMTLGDSGELVIPAALSIDGTQLLDGHYPAMAPIDPVRLKVVDRR
jgi:hypothetical protein